MQLKMVQEQKGIREHICQEIRRKECKQSSGIFSLSINSAPVTKQKMDVLLGSVVASPQLPRQAAWGGVSVWRNKCLPCSSVPPPQPGSSVGLRSRCTVGGFAPAPLLNLLLKVKGLTMHHGMLFPDFHVFSNNLVIWANLRWLSPLFPAWLRKKRKWLKPIDFKNGSCKKPHCSTLYPSKK